MSRKIRFLITGATGFIGSNITRDLVKKNYTPHILIRKASNLWRIKDLVSKMRLYEVDLLNRKLLEKMVKKIKPHVIFHLANAPLYQDRSSPISDYIDVNLMGTINLIDACKELDYRCFVNTGSSAEYGVKDKPMKEDDFCQPLSLYAISKLAATNYASYIGKVDKKPIVTFRLFSPFGSYDDPKRLMTETIYNALENKQIFLSDPKLVRDYIYIEDAISAYLAAIQKAEKLRGEIFNIGCGRQISVNKVIKTILKLTNSKSKIKWGAFEGRSFESKVWQADIEKAKKYLDWRPKYSFEEGMKKTLLWFKKNISFYKNKVRTFS